MKCRNCEKDFDPSLGDCPHCGAVPELDAKQMSSQEIHDFSGVTIDPEQDDNQNSYQRQDGPKVYVKKVSFSSGIFSIIFLVIIIGLFIFVAMPVFLILALVMAVIWFFAQLFI